MNKKQLIDTAARRTQFSRRDTEIVVEAVLDSITNALKNGERVQIVGFGMFEPRVRAARAGVDPQTKKKIAIPQSTVPAFRAGKSLKDSVNHRA